MYKNKKSAKDFVFLVLKNLKNFKSEDNFFVFYIFFLFFFILFFPILSISNIGDNSYIYYFLWNSMFLKTFFVLSLSFIILVFRNIVAGGRNIISQMIGFKENPNIFNFVLLRIIFVSYISIGESIKVASIVSSRLSMTKIYRFVVFLVLLGIFYTLYNVLRTAKSVRSKVNIYNHNLDSKNENNNHQDMNSLFGKLKGNSKM